MRVHKDANRPLAVFHDQENHKISHIHTRCARRHLGNVKIYHEKAMSKE
jgi:hypothetical protein